MDPVAEFDVPAGLTFDDDAFTEEAVQGVDRYLRRDEVVKILRQAKHWQPGFSHQFEGCVMTVGLHFRRWRFPNVSVGMIKVLPEGRGDRLLAWLCDRRENGPISQIHTQLVAACGVASQKMRQDQRLAVEQKGVEQDRAAKSLAASIRRKLGL